MLLKSIVAGRSGCSVWEKHEVEVDDKLFKGIPGLDMLRFPITEMFHVLFKGFVPKVVKQLLGSLTTLQRDIVSIRCLDCCVDRGEERPLYDIHHHPGSMTAHCWVRVCLLVFDVGVLFSTAVCIFLISLQMRFILRFWVDGFP